MLGKPEIVHPDTHHPPPYVLHTGILLDVSQCLHLPVDLTGASEESTCEKDSSGAIFGKAVLSV